MQRRFHKIREYAPGKNAQKTAAALRYDPEIDSAPEVVAVGKGITAERILELGREYGIPIYDDPVLTAALSQVNPGEEIPPELYTLVAQVLAYIYRVYHRHTGSTLNHPDRK